MRRISYAMVLLATAITSWAPSSSALKAQEKKAEVKPPPVVTAAPVPITQKEVVLMSINLPPGGGATFVDKDEKFTRLEGDGEHIIYVRLGGPQSKKVVRLRVNELQGQRFTVTDGELTVVAAKESKPKSVDLSFSRPLKVLIVGEELKEEPSSLISVPYANKRVRVMISGQPYDSLWEPVRLK